jgi:hypothetical protein
MGHPERLFTPVEATALLPELIAALERIRQARQAILARGERIRAGAPSNGGDDPGEAYRDALAALRQDVEAINGQGVILRDPETGLLDFPTRIDGRDVFLCWRLGEDRVSFWHGPETGFSGRRPL